MSDHLDNVIDAAVARNRDIWAVSDEERWAAGLARARKASYEASHREFLKATGERKAGRASKYHGEERRQVKGTAADRGMQDAERTGLRSMSEVSAMFASTTPSLKPAPSSDRWMWLGILAINVICLIALAGSVGFFD